MENEMLDDVILPDDVQEETAQPQAEEIEESAEVTNAEDTKPAEVIQEQTEPRIKVKYNHEEREITLDEARELAQKGMNYDKLQERLNEFQNAPELALIRELAEENGMSVSEYVEAVRQSREQERLNELIQQNIPEEYAKEILENRKFREQMQAREKEREFKEKTETEAKEELRAFQEAFPDVKEIPQEVWERVNEGTPLKYAYMEYEFKNLKNQVSILKQNETNKTKAPVGGVSIHGSNETAEDDFLRGFNSFD